MVLFPLVLNIALDTFFIQADTRDKVSDAPYAAVDVDVSYKLEALFDSLARFDFERLHDGRNGEVGWYFDLEMYMIFIGIQRMYVDRRILFDYRVAG